ncbi:MAG: hypothetical protein GX481_08905 [Atopobium sp.]|nr:hypothetical protein [Atopobium sp.]
MATSKKPRLSRNPLEAQPQKSYLSALAEDQKKPVRGHKPATDWKNIRIQADQLQDLQALAWKEHQSATTLLHDILTEYLQNHKA